MVVHYTLQGYRRPGDSGLEIKKDCPHTPKVSEPDNTLEPGWWAAQVASNKEYDTAREIISMKYLEEENVLVPRRMVYDVGLGDSLKKKTELVLPGYVLLKLGSKKQLKGLESMSNYIRILGRITENEIDIVKEHENIPETLDVHTGDKIIITRGPFAGVKGVIIEELDNEIYKCKLIFQGNEIMVNMKSNIIDRIA